jgi:hypothetical protein
MTYPARFVARHYAGAVHTFKKMEIDGENRTWNALKGELALKGDATRIVSKVTLQGVQILASKSHPSTRTWNFI